MKFYVAIIFLVLSTVISSAKSSRIDWCHGTTPCILSDRSYHVREPQDWDRKQPLPVLLHFHGWARQGSLVVNHRRIASATARRGVLLVAPNGLRGSWNFRQKGSIDINFAAEVLKDVMKRYPIKKAQVFVSGYSYGSAMAWRFACEYNGIAALLSISGSIDQSTDCAFAPQEIRHVHGQNDTIMRHFLSIQDKQNHPLELWHRRLACDAGRWVESWQARSWLTFQRKVWETCEQGLLQFDLNPGGHFIPHGWIARQLDELLGLSFSYP
ncbi:MAG: polyhydroxybutyrate depolymerase [Aestuariivita sp.]|nr:polyhydroxybutyrate depolymerase [Aestuariivita sp.]